MAYHNRKIQLIHTLNNFKEYTYKYNFEVIIVDDNSKEEERLYDILNDYEFKIIYKIIDIDEKKNNINPCIVYNKGFSLCNSEIVVIQNPECIHFTDILGRLSNLDFNNNYYTIPVISSPSFNHNQNIVSLINNNIDYNYIIDYLERENLSAEYSDSKGWYNHWIYRDDELKNLHFCSAISRNNLDKLEGFDETYSENLWYDDNEFKFRISKFLNIIQLEEELAIHLYHTNGSTSHNNNQLSIEINKQKYYDLKNRKDNNITWNINNIINSYKKM
jgi:GT2 family glycosyltransferase